MSSDLLSQIVNYSYLIDRSTCISVILVFNMAITNAERMKKYREKIKQDKVKYETMKAKARFHNNSIRKKLTGASLAEFRNKNKFHQQKFRTYRKINLINKPTNSFKSRQSFGKALNKVNSSLPKCDVEK